MRSFIKYTLWLCLMFASMSIEAQPIRKSSSPSKHKGREVLKWVNNVSQDTIDVLVINEYDKNKIGEGETKHISLNPNQRKELKGKDQYTFNVLKVKYMSGQCEEVYRVSKPDKSVSPIKKQPAEKPKQVATVDKKDTPQDQPPAPKPIEVTTVVADFTAFIDSIPFYSSDSIQADSVSIQKSVEILQLSSTDKRAYIEEQNLAAFINACNDTLQYYLQSDTLLISSFMSRYAGKEVKDSIACIDSLKAILASRIALRESHFGPLKAAVYEASEDEKGINWLFVGVGGGIIVLCLALLFWYYKVNKSNKQKTAKRDHKTPETPTGKSDTPLIQVIKPSTVALRKQNLDNVYDNEAYLRIPATDVCADSAVRNMYLKNSCIKDIYNMYAEDLRNPNNPNEDGCMVIGRWLYDEVSKKYDVSLEEIVRPGNDAVFAEYELNFGGKIKLRMSERLRKLRTETGLQYDLTCWVHSHPGLGVFFSNADNNVHLLLKHHAHPHFLTALVIDILTPKQDTGIFTFKTDGTINSKNDLTKMYSLEEMYKWALDSERRSFDANDYFNTLGGIKFHENECYGIQLSNGAIIDMSFLISKPNGFVGFVHGFTLHRGDKTECITSAVTKNEVAADSEMLGCFVVATHCSIPSIRKAVSRYLRDIHFVLVYTTTDGLLTSIPVVNQDLCTSDSYYGEQKLEDLKIWTRRRR